MNTYSVVRPFPFDSECFSRVRSEKNKPLLGGVNDTGDQYDWATTIYWWALIRLFSRVANTALGGDVCSLFSEERRSTRRSMCSGVPLQQQISHMASGWSARLLTSQQPSLCFPRDSYSASVLRAMSGISSSEWKREWEEMLGYASLRTLEGLYKRCKHKPKHTTDSL